MGGHGYSAYSKLGQLYNDNDVNLTWEGDNHVLMQQTTKHILEQAQKVMQKGKPTDDPLLEFLCNVLMLALRDQKNYLPLLVRTSFHSIRL